MSIPLSIQKQLAHKGGQYHTHDCTSSNTCTTSECGLIPPSKRIRTTMVKAGDSYLMVIHMGNRLVNLAGLHQLFSRKFTLCSEEDMASLCPDCNCREVPPFGSAYGIKAIMDKSVSIAKGDVFFSAGQNGLFIESSTDILEDLFAADWSGHSVTSLFSTDEPSLETDCDVLTPEQYKTHIQKLMQLPVMPGIANEIVKVRDNPYANAAELAAIVESDPSLAAQLLRYASSPFYAYQGKVKSVEQAIVRVLGMDFVMDFAFGLSLGKALRIPDGGALGLDSFWSHSMLCAGLTQSLCNSIEYSQRPSPGTAYLVGLLHNFGYLLMGHLFRSKFETVKRIYAQNPERSLEDIELKVMGVTHTQMGVWLMESWNMPEEVIETVREHRNPDYVSNTSKYANLVCLANRLLKRFDMGDADSMELTPELLEKLGLEDMQVEVTLGGIIQSRDGMEFMAAKMVA